MGDWIPGECRADVPEGFFCSRYYNHSGPCALHPVGTEDLGSLVCRKAPEGFQCSMQKGHPGTCTTYPIAPPKWEQDYPIKVENSPEKSGGKVNYYLIEVVKPHRGASYVAECSDIIESLGMDFNEGEAFKALWRKAAARKGKLKEGGDALYDAQKVAHFGARMVALLK